jgi:hypothetical protein
MESALSGGEARCPVPHAVAPSGGQDRA